MASDKQIKAAIKEGGKKGVDLAGVSAMGGVCFFNLAVDTPEGDIELLQSVIDGANAEVDESAEERKGGAGDIGKIFLSAGDKQLAIIAHVPKSLQESKNVSIQEWIEAILAPLPEATVVSKDDELVKLVIPGNADAGQFPLKMRDEAINAGFAFLRQKGLIPADDSSDDDVNYAEAAGVEW
ncbi:hypothetical protein QBZ16_003448 [Prototheca wickerhamii]|uniref:Uncharacterized protein n=1 Tax=Prototheca wickerhamii TaxID=3111 RepID=A0AAD9IHZ2_PROWI|nr:hypothetical protein QBZ16_003448 [Prototheca wickerhamii]